MSPQPAHRHVWSGLTTENAAAPVGILGVPFDGAVSFRPGAAHAPDRIRLFSSHVTPITEEGIGLRQGMIHDYGDVERDLDWGRYFAAVTDAALKPLAHPFTLFLGGDHSVTIPLHRAFDQVIGKPFGILHIDAHPDLCDTFEGHKWSHACTERRALELPNLKPENLVFCGIRSWEQQELDLLAQNLGIGMHSARSIHQRGIEVVAAAVIAQLSHLDAIYLTLDIDCLDPAYAPGTGTPEAGGLTSRQLLEFLHLIFAALPIRAMDIVEVSPPLDYSDITTVAALKVIYEVLGWVQAPGSLGVTQLPANVRAAFRDLIGVEPTSVLPVSGGMVNQSVRVEAQGVPYFVKWNAHASPGLFETEARGLDLLRASQTFRIPEVLVHGESSDALPAYLILEWIDAAPEVDQRRYAERFGQALAALHRVTVPTFGLDHDNYIGSMPQRNTPTPRWADFYRDQRVLPQMEIARKKGLLPSYREALILDLLERIDDLLDAPNPPSLLHGDLWSGNFIVAANSQPALVDPSVYYGDREVEIAYTQMFGGVSFFLDAYHEAYPLDPGYEDRRPLLHLYPMINHLNHFGEARFGPGVDMICRYYLDTSGI